MRRDPSAASAQWTVIVDHGREVRHFVLSPAPVMVTGVSQKMSVW